MNARLALIAAQYGTALWYAPERATCQCMPPPYGQHEGVCRAAAVERVNAIVGSCSWTPDELNVLGDAVFEAAKRRERHSDAWHQLTQLGAELHAAAAVFRKGAPMRSTPVPVAGRT